MWNNTNGSNYNYYQGQPQANAYYGYQGQQAPGSYPSNSYGMQMPAAPGAQSVHPSAPGIAQSAATYPAAYNGAAMNSQTAAYGQAYPGYYQADYQNVAAQQYQHANMYTGYVQEDVAVPDEEEGLDEPEEDFGIDIPKKKKLDMVCDTYYNMNKVLVQNILASDYFKSLYNLRQYHQVVDEIFKEVKHVESRSVGLQTPSTAWALLYKFFTMKLTLKQIHGLLNHKDSPYIRAVGFLYLRHVADPKTLWGWFEPFLDDEQEFSPSANKEEKMTMGEYVRSLLSGTSYYGTTLSRIPIPIEREHKKKLAFLDILNEKAAANEVYRDYLKEGIDMKAVYYEDAKYYDVTLEKILENGSFLVKFTEYGNTEEVHIGYLDIPASVKEHAQKMIDKKNRGKRHRSDSRDRSHSRRRSPKRQHRGNSPILDLEQEILRRERDSAVASGKDYARRPTSYKQALSAKLAVGTNRRRSRSPTRKTEVEVKVGDGQNRTRRSKSPPRKKVSAQHQAKMKALMEQYGDASSNKKKDKKDGPGNQRLQPRVEDADVICLGV